MDKPFHPTHIWLSFHFLSLLGFCLIQDGQQQHSMMLVLAKETLRNAYVIDSNHHLVVSIQDSDKATLITPYHDDVIKWKYFPCYWPFVRGNHRSPANSPHKGRWRGALMFSSICAWINGWLNNREAGDLRRHRAHYGVIAMTLCIMNKVWQEGIFITTVFLSHGLQNDTRYSVFANDVFC